METTAKHKHVAVWHDGCLDNQTGIDSKVAIRKWCPAPGDAVFERLDDKKNVFVGEIQAELYTSLTKRAFEGIVEYQGPESMPVLNSVLCSIASHETILNLTSRTAYGLANAERFCEMLSRRIDLQEEHRLELLIILQEAIANAVLHGNLEVESAPLEEGIPALEKQYNELEQKISDSALSDRRVEVTASWNQPKLTVCITNEGPGYDADKQHHIPSDAPIRGMELIRSLTDRIEIEKKGRQLKLFLRLPVD
jgi:anti-sigma regulatory factor (Ser/Thr protein kinase)